ncbi:MAG: NAD(P)H-dependent oxidoreductase [Thiotrichaceae bacterium]
MPSFKQALLFRHACKTFDKEKGIDPATFNEILEFGRLSPSSFGMEQWRFVIVETPVLREKLREACWGQPQITDSSHVMVILAKTAAVDPGTEYVEAMFKRRELPEELFKGYLEKYDSYFETEVKPYMSTFAWSSKQCYIALANMMTGAASLGIDSCPIEGFSREAVDTLLGVNNKEYQTAVLVTFGYRANEPSKHFRQKMDDLAEYI